MSGYGFHSTAYLVQPEAGDAPKLYRSLGPHVRRGPTWQPDSADPSSPPWVLASLRRRFGLVQSVVSGALMPLLTVCAGHQCLTPR
jgi:hypothetical protein